MTRPLVRTGGARGGIAVRVTGGVIVPTGVDPVDVAPGAAALRRPWFTGAAFSAGPARAWVWTRAWHQSRGELGWKRSEAESAFVSFL